MSATEASSLEPGSLYVVATPIGNLGDLTPRALHVLRHADVLAAEDTRVLRKLASAHDLGAGARLTPVHDHNERSRAPWVVRQLQAGRTVGLFSDAGTPLVSDPGFAVVRCVLDAGLPVVPVPGASALLCALVLAGLPTDDFRFCGFLPRQRGKRVAAIEHLTDASPTLVFYEAQQRVVATVTDLAAGLGQRQAAACCDLTKRGERTYRGTLLEVRDALDGLSPLRGEWVLVVEGAAPQAADGGLPVEAERVIEALLTRGLGARDVRDVVCSAFGTNKKETYAAVLAKRNG